VDKHSVGRDLADELEVPLVEPILHNVRVEEAVGDLLEDVEVARVVEEEVRRDVVRLLRVLDLDPTQ